MPCQLSSLIKSVCNLCFCRSLCSVDKVRVKDLEFLIFSKTSTTNRNLVSYHSECRNSLRGLHFLLSSTDSRRFERQKLQHAIVQLSKMLHITLPANKNNPFYIQPRESCTLCTVIARKGARLTDQKINIQMRSFLGQSKKFVIDAFLDILMFPDFSCYCFGCCRV